MYLSMCFRAAPSHVHKIMSSPVVYGCGVYRDIRGPSLEKDGGGNVGVGCVANNMMEGLSSTRWLVLPSQCLLLLINLNWDVERFS